MKHKHADVVIIGSGPAGLGAAVAARQAGAEKVLIIERDSQPGGILQQCVHAGFGLNHFGEELTGPEYATRFIEQAQDADVDWLFETTVLEIRDEDVLCASSQGLLSVSFDALILAMGCRERTRGSLRIPGTRPSGIFNAGTAQRLINIEGQRVGSEIVILGSGDIGMIMARRLTLEGAHVICTVELMPQLSGLLRNKIQCLDDFGIPLLLSHTITEIKGEDRIAGVVVAPVDQDLKPDYEKSQFIACDTLLISTGLIPENELTRAAGIEISAQTGGPVVNGRMQTAREDVFACGNVVHVTGLVDDVTTEALLAGKCAAEYAAAHRLERS